MTFFLVALAILGVLIWVVVAWLWRQEERSRVARQWSERERLLDRRRPPPSPREVLQRRARRT
ncbi:MAG TPA: hypothetical protein VLK35_08310 [Methylomirabilota bacterium]|nr:hypothetical protein [Methylomirabilota bacterium]